MLPPEAKLRLIREQAQAKIHWGSSRAEVAQWLLEKQAIAGADADMILDAGFRARRKALRERAMVRLVIAATGLILVGAFMYIRFFSGVIFYGTSAMILNIAALAVTFFSVRALLQSLGVLRQKDAVEAVE